ncbi:MAG: hypothetical protein ACC628_20850, partial [Pirellulaceae bacterium]
FQRADRTPSHAAASTPRATKPSYSVSTSAMLWNGVEDEPLPADGGRKRRKKGGGKKGREK